MRILFVPLPAASWVMLDSGYLLPWEYYIGTNIVFRHVFFDILSKKNVLGDEGEPKREEISVYGLKWQTTTVDLASQLDPKSFYPLLINQVTFITHFFISKIYQYRVQRVHIPSHCTNITHFFLDKHNSLEFST
jgi:hypothetical protein